MRSFLTYILGVLLFLLAWLLFLPLSIMNYVVVLFKSRDNSKGYFLSSAANIDRFANREFRTLWNWALRKQDGYKFGLIDETISSVLGKNKINNTLSRAGIALAFLLDSLDRNHCIKSIDHHINW